MTTDTHRLVTVFGNKREEVCSGGGWGPKWSSEETTQFLARNLEWKYGGSVLVEYIDLGHDQNQKDYPEVIEAVSQYDLEFPLVAIDGELRMAGGINFGMIYEAIEKGRSEDAADEREEGE